MVAVRTMVAALLAVGGTSPCWGQTTTDNAVRSAEDAFGTIVGDESLGLYGTDSVRGFSPAVAGNNRIEGLYVDLLAPPTGRIRSGITIRVGPAAQGYPFPAPTGIVEYSMKGRSTTRSLSTDVYVDSYDSYGYALNAELPVSSLSLTNALGFGASRISDGYGGRGRSLTYGGVSRAALSDQTEVAAFLGGRQTSGETALPIYVADGEGAFPRAPRGPFLGPDWATKSSYNSLAGVMMRSSRGGWTLRGGLFRSETGDSRSFQNLVVQNGPRGFQRLLIVFPRARASSVSGEARLSRAFRTGAFDQRITLMVRGRSNGSRFGGEQDIDLGAVASMATRIVAPPVPLAYGPQSSSAIRQWTFGVDYSVKVGERGELALGVQRAAYAQTLRPADAPGSRLSEGIWLPSISAGVALTDHLSLYASVVRGLEDGGSAPGFAANGNQVLPAFRTRQWDAGVRWRPGAGTTVILGYFDIRKPYLTFDAANVYRQIGDEHHQGVEASVTAQVGPRLVIVAGGLVGAPRVEDIPAAPGGIGARPVGQPDVQLQLNADYSIPGIDGLSVNAGLSRYSSQAASVDNRIFIDGYTTMDMGLRFRGRVGRTPYTLRLTGSNIADAYRNLPVGDNVYIPLGRRNIGLDLILDI